MKIVFLGTGGYHPNERRHTAGILVPELGLAFDAGTSFFRASSRLETSDLTVFLTHAHLDHICGLTYLLNPILTGQIKSCRVVGDAKTLNAVRQHLFSEAIFPVDPPFEMVPLEASVTLGDATIRWVPLEHPGGSLGYRVDHVNGASFAYITDTTVSASYLPFLEGVELLIHECYFPDSQREWAVKTGHSVTSQVAQFAADAGAGRLYLTHIDPANLSDDPIGLAHARAIFPNTFLAEDLFEIPWGDARE